MQLEDWRESPSERLAPLLERQRTRWLDELGWDAGALFSLIEQARAGGQLPGLVAVDEDGTLAGWCYASAQDGLLFIGALHGDRADVIRQLLDAVLATPEASYARAYRCFMFPENAAVGAALARRRFELESFLYLSRPIHAHRDPAWSDPSLPSVRLWTPDDLPETARLLGRAYAGTAGARCFAPSGRLEEWAAYLAQLIRTPACGTWSAEESLAVPSSSSDAVLAAALVATRLSDTTTHVAQVAVDPRSQRQGLAAALLGAAAARAAAAGARRQTLLVADSNTAARALYARLGFDSVTSFLFAERPRISRAKASAECQVPSAKCG
jgi:ribosomal protein S18 acetylase RimI-like enzyme